MKNTKKLFMFSCLFLIMGIVFVAGCVDSNPAPAPPSNDTNTTVPPIADAALYRGEVASVAESSGQINVTLKQVEGTNFGAQEIEFWITNNTTILFNKSEIKEGKYLEVYYGGESKEPQMALAVNLLPDADNCIYNGVVTDISQEGTVQSGTITLALDDDKTMIFAYSTSTQFYLTFSDLKVGDKLNIYTTGNVNDSDPQQTDAKEVRLFYAAP
jgi:hypothetical protein